MSYYKNSRGTLFDNQTDYDFNAPLDDYAELEAHSLDDDMTNSLGI